MLWVNWKPTDWNSCYGLWCISPPNRLLQTKELSNMMDCFDNLPQSPNVALGTTRIVDCPLCARIPMVHTLMFALLRLCVGKRDYRTTGGVIRSPNLVYFSDRNNCCARQILQGIPTSLSPRQTLLWRQALCILGKTNKCWLTFMIAMSFWRTLQYNVISCLVTSYDVEMLKF